ncbi:MAG TPA: DUF2807 domain-containing protein [Cyclobacteriaceae bacterium]|nr:DUF2807 domain-containing protein [Cyclobacteriaceae bacterium]
MKKEMKREGHIYLLIGLMATALIFHQYNPFKYRREKLYTEVRQIEKFNKLFLDIQCNIFIVEGERPGIVYEGSKRLLRNIEIEVKEGCVFIRNNKEAVWNALSGIFTLGSPQLLNIYVVVRDIDSVDIEELLSLSGPADISPDRINVLVSNNTGVTIGIKKCFQKV